MALQISYADEPDRETSVWGAQGKSLATSGRIG